jgi:hypothetical protein
MAEQMKPQRKMTRSEWARTPYAGSQATRTEDSASGLLSKYGVQVFQWTQGRGQNGRPAIQFRFELKGKTYRVMIETLLADASPDELIVQAKRAIYHYLKSALEMASVFVPMEKTLFAFLELPGGYTCFEAAAPYVNQLEGPDFGRLMLPAPPATTITRPMEDVIDAET